MELSAILKKAHEVCGEYLGGGWSRVSPDEIAIESVSGGFVNDLFKISLPSHIATECKEPRQVLMRNINGLWNDRGQYGLMCENIIAILLAEKKLAPKVYAVFESGRLEEFIPSRIIKSADFHNPEILDAIVRKLARIHAQVLPISKDPNYLFNKLEQTLDEMLNDLPKQIKNDPHRQKVWDKMIALNPREEVKWLKKLKDSVNSPVIFSHNDFYSHNILLLDEPGDDLVQVVDFETSCYFFRGLDIATLFVCYTFIISPDPPYFKMDCNKFPKLEEQKIVFRTYLDEFKKNCNYQIDIEKEEEKLFEECQIFHLIFYFFWITLTLYTPHRTKENMNWIQFCDIGIDEYAKLKKMFVINRLDN